MGRVAMADSRTLRLLSYNIQAGLSTRRFSHYLTHSWKQLLPVPSRMENLDGIARVLKDYDLVGLQEVDCGSLRSGFVNQIRYLAQQAHFPHVHEQSNRQVGAISRHGNALLSRLVPSQVNDHKLPGLIPGRGLLHACFGEGENTLHLFILHLALGRRGRLQQLAFLAELLAGCQHVVVMGDLNCRSASPELRGLFRDSGLLEPAAELFTFPSWRPSQQLDHILVSPTIQVKKVAVLSHTYSDHLPIAMHVELPEAVCQAC